MTTTTDARGQVLAFTYDDAGRRTETRLGSASGTKVAEWTYDTLRKGLLTSSTRWVNGNAYIQRVDSYDAQNRPLLSSVVIPSVEGNLAGTYTYQASYTAITGKQRSQTFPAVGSLPQETVTHDYNVMGQPEATHGLNTYASEHLYTPYGETARVTLGASPKKVWLSSSYADGTRRMQNVQVKRDTVTQPMVADRTYDYDAYGNVLKIADAPAAGPVDTQCFNYDNRQRLTSAWTPTSGDCAAAKSASALGGAAPYWQDYTYDEIGNRTSLVKKTATSTLTETYAVPASGPTSTRPHSVTSVTKASGSSTALDEYTYDAAGNTVTRKLAGATQTLEWDAEGELVKTTEANGAVSQFLHDADGNRLIRRDASSTTLYLPGQEAIRLPNGAINTKRYYSHGGTTVAMRSNVDGLQYFTGDHHGTDDISITEANSLYVTRRYSDPFGGPRGAQPRYWPDDKGFVDGIKDANGLTAVGARSYDPRTGRFVSTDPVFETTESFRMNAYGYANNNPTTYSDPTGLRLSECEGFYSNTCPDGRIKPTASYPNTQAEADDHHAKVKNQQQAKNQAARELGMSAEEVAHIEQEAAEDKGFWGVMLQEAPDIIGDLTGFNDVRDCFTKMNLWACAGLIPVGKLLTLLGSAKKIYKAVQKALAYEERMATIHAKLNRLRARTLQLARAGEQKLANMAAGCKRHSFPPGTLVLMADGSTKPIEQVSVGDHVVATDPETGETFNRKVTTTWVHDNEPTRTELTFSDGSKLSGTDWHPVWVADLNKWVPIAKVTSGSWLQTSSGTWLQVTAARQFTDHGKAYDLTVDQTHTYYVLAGNTSVLVHNSGGTCPLHRSDTRGPDEIFESGFEPRGDNMDLLEHASGYSRDSGYIATSTSESVAIKRGGNVYEIRGVDGVDVNKEFPGNPFAHEKEIAIPGRVDASCIVACRLRDGTRVPNPNYGGG
ncbi:polymorphic toxin-type HINT domain-containing protein [Actinokineospora pegani]|uniref:polymorphic toxin-type HINT domain-containing protein n=1 Tax=Actinokineospora pegani TaxID=2654637 RepID=UPI0012E9EC35